MCKVDTHKKSHASGPILYIERAMAGKRTCVKHS